MSVTRDQALAFRLAGHNLTKRLPAGSLLQAAGACGIQNTPPGSAWLSLHARVVGLSPGEIAMALAGDKTLLQTMSLRGAPHIFPTADAGVFTAGLLPDGEEDLCFFIHGVRQALTRVGISATDAVSLSAAALSEVLDGRELTKDQLGIEVAERVARQLKPQQLISWRSQSWYAPGQTLGESTTRFTFYAIALQSQFCYAPRHDNEATFLRTDQWLGARLPEVDRDRAAVELVRRYLHCYGPSTAGDFAEWTGISPAQASRAWALAKDELEEVDFHGRKAWVHRQDVPCLTSLAMPEGARLLPPHDPYLQMRDRATLVPDLALHSRLWRAVGNPGGVIADGQFVGTWRGRKTGRKLSLSVELFKPVASKAREEIEAEASTIAPFKGCKSTEVKLLTRYAP
jgi:hypothetical protein